MKNLLTAAPVAALTPAQKMELADLLYDLAAKEMEAAEAAGRRRQSRTGGRRPEPAGRFAIDPWAGFSERLLQRQAERH